MIAGAMSSRRLVTITGPGGIGKTSVAMEVVRLLSGAYQDGAYLVDLASVSDPDMVVAALASVFQVPAAHPDSTLPAVLNHLGEKQVLIALDNCEQVVEAAACLTENLLKASADITILVTSREPLRAEGEWVFRLSALETPPNSEALDAKQALAFPAVRLFVERAESCPEPFLLTDSEAPLLAEVCRSLDGVPLAIELAAARVGLLGIAGIAARLDDRFSLLTRGRRTAPPRHKNLRAMLDWSFNLLSKPEQKLLTRLSVFRTPFTKEDAVAIAACEKLPASDVLDGLTDLTAKSLATASLHGSSVVYRLFETTRVYAATKLSVDREKDEIFHRHAQYCCKGIRQRRSRHKPA
jgi:predicted ATPase